jgi:AraC-like DNA-binding protein
MPVHPASPPAPEWDPVHGPDTDDNDLAALREAFPGYRFRRRFVRGVPCYLAEAHSTAPRPADVPPDARPAEARGAAASDAPLAAARDPAVLADMLAAAAGRPVRLRASAVATAYRDRQLTLKQCATVFGVSRTTVMKFLAAEGVTVRRPGRDLDEQAVAAAYRDEGLSLHQCAVHFGISERRVAAILDRQGVPRRPVGRPPRHPHTRPNPV